MYSFNVKTGSRFDLIKITDKIKKFVKDENITDGIITVFVPHTTAAVTINEGADPSVVEDIKKELDEIIPLHDNYSHMEGNSAAHIKSSLIGASENIMVENGSLVLGTWQAVFFCEFDGPRTRKVYVKVN
ncbi:MAG: secondary thiamine-phosphate synthase enzyme YjbQ [Candidatus Cloacimonetes bacterium]|nr:secondary thiamine-phosphate synthase enzyme YjbQ [Candidatus Cloacimonadota bacterium]MBS3766843.1 secondary thiamine-phosphate synthase enzyme YjbQ [Candidatus Cloacimonadota bacterium]